jgi:hypothetical protein
VQRGTADGVGVGVGEILSSVVGVVVGGSVTPAQNFSQPLSFLKLLEFPLHPPWVNGLHTKSWAS